MDKRMLAVLVMAVLFACNASAIVYVNKSATGPEDGTSWATAFRTIQAGINAAAALPGGDEVWVAQGVYNEVRTEPWGAANVTGSLVLKDNVQLYGGFRGTETLRTQRSVYNHSTNRPRTIIDGSVSRAGSPAYHVVVIGKATSPNVNIRIDGFGITGGRAVGIATFYHTYRGAGIYNWISSPVIANCMIYGNIAQASGGGMANESRNIGGTHYAANTTLINCVFFDNTARRNLDWESNPVRGGGGLFLNVDPNNWGVLITPPAPTLINCTFSGNILTNPGASDPPAEWGRNSSGIYNFCNLPEVTNSIVYANANGQIKDETTPGFSGGVTAATYSDIQGGWPGTGNINADPLFTDAGAGNFILQSLSPCINTGTNSVVNPRDLRGVTRPREVIVEMGAFEHDDVPPQALCNGSISVTLVNGVATITAMDVDNGSSDIPPTPGADIDIYSIDKSTFDCADLAVSVGGGPIPVVLTVTDYANNSASCTAQATVQGGAPYFENPNAITLTPDQGTPLLIRTYRGLSASFSITACGGNINRQFTWYFDDGVNPPEALPTMGSHPRTGLTGVSVVVSGLDSTLSLTNVQEATSGDYYCVLSDDSGNPPAVSGVAELVVRPPVAVTNPTPNITLRTGSDVSWSVVASGGYGPPYNYQWQRNVAGSGWQNVPAPGLYLRTMYPGPLQYIVETEVIGSNEATFTILRALKNDGAITPVTLDEGQYRVQVNDGSGLALPGGSVTSGISNLVLEDKVKFVVHPQDAGELYEGDSANFNVAVIGGSGPYVTWPPDGYVFVWEINAEGVGTGTTIGCTNTFSIPYVLEVQHSGDLVCKVSDWNGGIETTDISNYAFITVKKPVAVTAPIGGHRNTGGSITLSVVASQGYPGYTYQWQFDDGGGYVNLTNGSQPNGSDVSGATDSEMTVSTLTVAAAGNYRCVVTDSVGTGSGSVGISANATLTVTDLLSVGPTTVFSSTYGGAELYVGDDITLEVIASGGEPPYTYQWYRGTTPVGTNSSQLVITSATTADGGVYSCEVEDNSPDPAVTSAPLTVTVYQNLAIDQDPASQTWNVGESVTFTVVAIHGWGDKNYQWQYDDGLGGGFVNLADGGRISGANAASLTINPLEQADAGSYRCVVTDSGPGPQTQTSAAAVLTVTNFLIIVTDLPATHDVYEGDTISLAITVGGGVPPYDYTWKKVGDPGFSAPNQNILQITPAAFDDAGQYFVTVSDQSGGVNPDVDSGVCAVSVYAPLDITEHPQSVAVYEYAPVTFTVTATGGIPEVNYQWYADVGAGFQPIPEGFSGLVFGTQSPTLSILSALPALDGLPVMCMVSATPSDDLGSVVPVMLQSSVAVLTVVPQLIVSTPPDEKAYVDDPDFEMSVTISGGLNPSAYQWQRRLAGQGTFAPIPGGSGPVSGNSAALLVSPAVENIGVYDYRVAVTDDIGSANSGIALVEFDGHLTITSQPSDVTVPRGGRAEFSVAISGGLGDITFQWEKDDGAKAFQPIIGENGPTLVIDPVTETDEGSYRVTISDTGSTVTPTADTVVSTVATLTIGEGVPLAGLGGIALLSAATALAGAVALRRRKQ